MISLHVKKPNTQFSLEDKQGPPNPPPEVKKKQGVKRKNCRGPSDFKVRGCYARNRREKKREESFCRRDDETKKSFKVDIRDPMASRRIF